MTRQHVLDGESPAGVHGDFGGEPRLGRRRRVRRIGEGGTDRQCGREDEMRRHT